MTLRGKHVGDQPACWKWPVEGQDVENARHYAQVPGWDPASRFDTVTLAILLWQRYRCAICGVRLTRSNPIQLVRDHDHHVDPELFRGWLCRGCNLAEGKSTTRALRYQGYRERSPAVMLDVRIEHHDSFRRGPTRGVLRQLLDEQAELHAEMARLQHEVALPLAEPVLAALLANHQAMADALRRYAG